MLLAVDTLSLPEHNALWASIPPLCYASLCLDSTTHTKTGRSSHRAGIDTFLGLFIICSHEDNFPHLYTILLIYCERY